jgi:hypothetical protein
MATLFVVVVMSISQINECMHRLMFAKKKGFGKGVMRCSSDRLEHEVGRVKNIICEVCKCCCSFFSSTVRLVATSLSNMRVSCKILAQCNLLRRGVRSSSSSFRWSRGSQRATKCV